MNGNPVLDLRKLFSLRRDISNVSLRKGRGGEC